MCIAPLLVRQIPRAAQPLLLGELQANDESWLNRHGGQCLMDDTQG